MTKTTYTYNPLEDNALHASTVQERTIAAEDRAPFNEALQHGDAVQGFRTAKRLEQFPAWYRNPRRIYAAVSVLVFAAFMIYQVVRIIMAIAAGK
ncbi:hypothetical protein LJK88_07060 [Paenibacillus sp. P26]|nr:hypothetical protein LJK88_07060 [Paenibacillus sp. P26]UUZ90275.1 hypothetical protein LJK87_30500 [Paenibacillus sp. P25]